MARKPVVLNATNEAHIDEAFAAIVQLAARHCIPAIYAYREQVETGGLISYGASRSDAYRQAGNYVGPILKGENPGTLPVVLPTKFELLLNLRTAKALGLSVPLIMQKTADEVIEQITERRHSRRLPGNLA